MIESAQYSNEEQTSVSVVFNGENVSVPVDADHRYYQMLMSWVAEGNTISPYQPPPEPTDADIVEQILPQSGNRRVLFNLLLAMVNRILTLEGNNTITSAQFKKYIENQLNG